MALSPSDPPSPAAPAAASTVLLVLPAVEVGETAEGVVGLARALRQEGWRPLVASAGGRLEVRLRSGGVEHRRLPLDSRNPLVVAANVRRLAGLAADAGARLVHAHPGAAAWSAAAASRKVGVPLVTTVQVLPEPGGGPLGKAWAMAPLRGDRVIAVSHYLAEQLAETGLVPADRIRVVHPGVDLGTFDPARIRGDRMARLAEAWRVGPERSIVLVPGRLAPATGHLLLLRAMAVMTRRDFVVVCSGPGEVGDSHARRLEAALRESGLAERVRFAGECRDLPAALMLADVVVLPATGPEPFAVAIAEAQAMGKPVVVTARGGLAETLQPASTGWLVKPEDPEELAWAIDRALDLEPDVRERLAVRARAFVADALSLERTARGTADAYRELARSVAPLPQRA